MLLISIIRSIVTKPGYIPENKEWDILSDYSSAENSDDETNKLKISKDEYKQL